MENITERLPTVDEVQKSFQKFSIADYLVFAGMLIGCSGIGLYYAFKGKKDKNTDEATEYLMGGRNMKVFPVSMSLVASFISGITLLGLPTEMYLHGCEFMFEMIGIILVGVLASHLVLPVFHDLQLSSTYEYLRMRFDKNVQLMGSILFAFGTMCWLPIVIYVPALAFNQGANISFFQIVEVNIIIVKTFTGVNVHIITPIVCIICIIYTSIGGLKAVVWTDVVQMIIMVGATFVIIIKGTIDIGGLEEVWKQNWESGRLEIPSFRFDMTIRHSMMSLTVGIIFHFLLNAVVNQNMIQRYLTLPTLAMARRALWIFIFGTILFVVTCGYAGHLAYATYHDCDPLKTGLAKAKDQVLPLLVMRVLGDYPGFPGVFVAGVFSAALSSLSTGLNSMAAVVLEDFIKSNRKTPLSDRATRYILRGVVVIFGVICVALVFVVEKLGSVLQLSMSLSAITSGAAFGIFFGGMLLPWMNAKGALWGSVLGMTFSSIMVVGAQRAQAIGAVVYPNKPSSVVGCDYTFPAILMSEALNSTLTTAEVGSVFPLYRVSYLFYTPLGGMVTIICASIISYFTGGNDYMSMNPLLFSPVVRNLMPRRKSDTTLPEEKELLQILKKNQYNS